MEIPKIETIDDGHYRVHGELSFANATALLAASRDCFGAGGEIDFDLSGVSRADSAGLALLLEGMRMAAAGGQQIRYHQLPEQMVAIARASNLETLLPLVSE